MFNRKPKPPEKAKSENIYIGSMQQTLRDMMTRVQKFPEDDHYVSLNGEERLVTAAEIPDFIAFCEELILELDATPPQSEINGRN